MIYYCFCSFTKDLFSFMRVADVAINNTVQVNYTIYNVSFFSAYMVELVWP